MPPEAARVEHYAGHETEAALAGGFGDGALPTRACRRMAPASKSVFLR